MIAEKNNKDNDIKIIQLETLETFVNKKIDYKISNLARFTGFQHRSKVEFLRFFIV